MENGGFSFKRKEHDRIILKSYEHLYKEKAFHDVTLISTDFIPMKAHKTVHFAANNFFKTLFNIELNQASNSVLYLKGINSLDLNLILAFIYLGEVNVSEDRVDDFLNIASELQLEGFSSDGDMNINILENKFINIAKLRSAQQLISCECSLKCTFLRCCQEKIASTILVCLSYILLHLCSSAG